MGFNGLGGPKFCRGVQGWDAVLLGVEWNTGQEEVVIFPVIPGTRRNSWGLGFELGFRWVMMGLECLDQNFMVLIESVKLWSGV